MRKFRIGYNMMLDGAVVFHTKCVFAHSAHNAKSKVSRDLFLRGILHAIKLEFFTFPGVFFMDRDTAVQLE